MMLNTGTMTTKGDVVTISGRLELTPKIPAGIYPFEKATVSWRFVNVSIPFD